ETGLTFAPEVVASRAFGRFRVAANVGVKLRSDTELANLTVDHELFMRVGAGYRMGKVEVDATLSGATKLTDPFGTSNINALELLGAVVGEVGGETSMFAAAGFGVSPGFGTPDWRALAGVRFSPRCAEPIAPPAPPPVVVAPPPPAPPETLPV